VGGLSQWKFRFPIQQVAAYQLFEPLIYIGERLLQTAIKAVFSSISTLSATSHSRFGAAARGRWLLFFWLLLPQLWKELLPPPAMNTMSSRLAVTRVHWLLPATWLPASAAHLTLNVNLHNLHSNRHQG
jgi:hypothetical protein